jgi:hypothetical protein
VLRGRWCNTIFLNAHAPTEEKNDVSKDSFNEKLEQVFDHFPKYHIKILLGDFNAKLGRVDIFKPTIGNESLHEDSNNNGVGVVNFATSKNLVVHCTRTETFINTPGPLLMFCYRYQYSNTEP